MAEQTVAFNVLAVLRSALERADQGEHAQWVKGPGLDPASPCGLEIRQAGVLLNESGGTEAMMDAAMIIAKEDPHRYFALRPLLDELWRDVGEWAPQSF